MRIAYSSDLHIDASAANRQASMRLAGRVEELTPDVLVIAGDLGNTLEALGEALALFSGVRALKLFVAGNHDVWVEGRGNAIDSRTKYKEKIPEVCAGVDFTDLTRGPVAIGRVAFVGSLGWYDYSFADPRLGLSDEDYWRGRYNDEIWWDREMTFWPSRIPAVKGAGRERLRDTDVCHEMASKLDADLREVESGVDEIVAVVHTLPFLQTLRRSDPPFYLDAFTGAEQLGRTFARHPKVTHHIGGHKHVSGDWTVAGIQSHRRIIGRIADDDDIEAAVESALGLLEVG